MAIPRFDYVEARSLRDACRLLAEAPGGAEPLAGGTELLLALKHRTRSPGLLVDLASIPGLDELRFSAVRGLTVGARVTLSRFASDADVGLHYPALAEAARSVGSPELRSMGTVGGNLCQDACCMFVDRSTEQRDGLDLCHKLDGGLCHVVADSDRCWATYSGDLAPALIVLAASIEVASAESDETRPLASLYSGDGKRPLALRPGQLVTRVDVPPPPPRSGAAYLKLRQRGSLDYPLLGAAAAVTLAGDGRCERAAVALTGVDRGPVVIPDAARLEGQLPTPAALAEVAAAAGKRVQPVKNVWGYSASYRLKMVAPYVTRALDRALARAARGGQADA